ncbi:MAG: branched-chain amino acid ABC transporter permease [Synergistaceae bacterium]|jgi:branched-chain amino acid transport system permease protein|nr:branched-chain amino acid ABC transporter permease [Synergistaceae bacterium]
MNFLINLFIPLTISGLAMGVIYALMAMGLMLLIRAIGVLNFAQGDLLMFGAYLTYCLKDQLKLPLLIMWISAFLLFAVFGAIFMFSVYYPMRDTTWRQTFTITTIAASFILKDSVQLIWGTNPISVKPLIAGSVKIFGTKIAIQYLLIIGIAAVIIWAVFVIFEKLYAGRMMQAATQDKYAAEIIGIPTMITTLITYMIVVVIAGTAGYMVAPIFFVNPTLGTLQLSAFAGVILGGFGNLKGAVVGSIIIGLIQSYSTLITTTYKDTIVFLVIILVLIFRPQGIFLGSKISDKA